MSDKPAGQSVASEHPTHTDHVAHYIAAVLIAALGVVLIIGALQFINPPGSHDRLGPSAFPLGLGVLLLILAAALAVATWRRIASTATTRPLVLGHTPWSFLVDITALALYALLLPSVGYVITTLVYTSVVVFLCGEGGWKSKLFIPLGFVALTYVVFVTILGINLPQGGLGI